MVFQSPPILLVILFITNLMVPSYFANKLFHVTIFRYIFFFIPIIFVFSWTLCMKSIFFGLMAAIMWKHYDPKLIKKGAPQEFLLLRIIIEITQLYLTCCLFFMVNNPEFYKDYRELLIYVLILKVTLNFGLLILFKPPSFFYDSFIDVKNRY